MKITTLIENRTLSEEYKCQHGLSLYIETEHHKILFDTGADKSFVQNAKKLGITLEDIDMAIISHGHSDHGGGLEAFLELNDKAKIYIGKGAFKKHVKQLGFVQKDIGLNKNLMKSDRFIFLDKTKKIDDELMLIGDVQGEKLIPQSNDNLLQVSDENLAEKDDFNHEISLVINENNRSTLFCGCAHKGIVNIIEKTSELIGEDVNNVIGGFHLKDLQIKEPESRLFLDQLSKILVEKNIDKYYTCHCTGEPAYNYLRQKMMNLDELKTGKIIEI